MTTAPAPDPEAGAVLAGAWTGEQIVYWGAVGHDPVGAAYDPVGDAWSSLAAPGAPALIAVRAFWTGAHVLVWGESNHALVGDGARYAPGAAAWTPIAGSASPESFAAYASAVWTGRALVIWGGATVRGIGAEGLVYDAAGDAWRATAPRPAAPRPAEDRRAQHVAVWTGSEMLVWGGVAPDGSFLATGLRYRP